jgi:hypothetical protein
MSRLPRVRSPGGWTGDLPPSDLAELDQRQFRAITKRGGAWFAQDAGIGGSNFIGIAGAQGLEITGPSRLDKVTDLHFGTGIQLQYETREVTRELPLYRAGGPGWTFGPSPQEIRPIRYGVLAPVLYQASVPVEGINEVTPIAIVRLPVPVGAVLKRIVVKLRGNHNPNDPLPEGMPGIRVERVDEEGQRLGATALVSDASESTEGYNEAHEIDSGVIPSITNDGSFEYRLEIHGESGEEAFPGLIVWSVRATVEISIHDEWQV